MAETIHPCGMLAKFEGAFDARRLGNWEIPKQYPSRPRTRQGNTTFIANNSGHLLPHIKKTDEHPWGNFKSTYELPKRITREFIENYNYCLTNPNRYKHFGEEIKTCNEIKNSICEPKCVAIKRIIDISKLQEKVQKHRKTQRLAFVCKNK
ncbi:protein Flattop homolog [Teleopsis dalmanni]|uniref:protein Flattop homolog n=1 Tax=Teleopsis dalmanni TaxID=139649 RepID=UPI0018CCD1DB|nr:protein Flattop homolog [Teleopsis dalmanni]